jgi:hypothetical protein
MNSQELIPFLVVFLGGLLIMYIIGKIFSKLGSVILNVQRLRSKKNPSERKIITNIESIEKVKNTKFYRLWYNVFRPMSIVGILFLLFGVFVIGDSNGDGEIDSIELMYAAAALIMPYSLGLIFYKLTT